MPAFHTQPQRGYIALMAVIVISLMLLAMVGEESLSGSFLRSSVLGTENKERSESLARGCADIAAAALAADPAYTGGATLSFVLDGSETALACTVGTIEHDEPVAGQATIQVQSDVSGAVTELTVTVEQSSGGILQSREIP